MSTVETPGILDFDVTREIVRTTALRAYAGWTVRVYRDTFGRETFDATNGVGLSPLEPSFADAVFFAKHGTPPMQDEAWYDRRRAAETVAA